MPKFMSDIDMERLQLLNAVIHNSATAPTTPANGQLWFDSSNMLLKVWIEDEWKTLLSQTPTEIVVENEAADTTCYILFATGATGALGIKSSSFITFNASNGILTLSTNLVSNSVVQAPNFILTDTSPDGTIRPQANDAGTLGIATHQWSDLFLAEGGTINWDNGDAVLTQAGDVVTLSGADLKVSSPGNASTSVLTTDGTQTETNKRITPRSGTAASTATLTLDSDAYDIYTLTAQAEALSIANPSGTPTNGQKIIVRIKDNGTARAITWSGSYWRAIGITLPTTTVISKTVYVGAIWNSADSKWDVIALAQEA